MSTTAPQRLYLMQVAYLPPSNIPVVCYLIQTEDGKNILVDTGLSATIPLPPGLEPVMQVDVITQLAQLGVQPSDIDTVICTHFDIDHAGNQAAFTQATFVVQQAHYETALHHPRFAAVRPEWDQSIERYQFVEGDTQLLPGIDLIETSGHVPGHQSVVVRLPETGAVLLAIDAVADERSFTPDRQVHPRDDDPTGVLQSTHKLLDLVEKENINLVVFGHDVQQWEQLKKLPAYYS